MNPRGSLGNTSKSIFQKQGKAGNLKGTDKFLLLYDLSKLNQEDANSSGGYVMRYGTERVIASQESHDNIPEGKEGKYFNYFFLISSSLAIWKFSGALSESCFSNQQNP